MSEHVPHKHPAAVVMNGSNQPVLISANIEHDEPAHSISVWKRGTYFGIILPVGAPGSPMPRS
jgi:hypothetical protein